MTLTPKSRLAPFIAMSVSLFISGCAVGPKFKRPTPPDVPGYTPTPISTTSSTPDAAVGKRSAFLKGAIFPESGGHCFARSRSAI